ncbi:hypothetical protein, partial [Pseudomonas izuensis]|uniref:hypothetical protein n=1 Tax=Pseudomonas izuensis TaxID=2684212 RepID=UPI001C49BBFC
AGRGFVLSAGKWRDENSRFHTPNDLDFFAGQNRECTPDASRERYHWPITMGSQRSSIFAASNRYGCQREIA